MNRKSKQVFFFPFTPSRINIKGKLSRGSVSNCDYPFKPHSKRAQGDHLLVQKEQKTIQTGNQSWETFPEKAYYLHNGSLLTTRAIENTAGAIDTTFDTVFLRKEALVGHLGYMSFNNLRKAVMWVYIHVCVVSTSHTVSSLLDVGWGKVRAKTSPIMSARCNRSQVE